MTDIKDGDFVLELANGGKIVSEGEDYEVGAMVRVMNPAGKEIGYWQCNEWEEDAEQVMGAILRCAAEAGPGPIEKDTCPIRGHLNDLLSVACTDHVHRTAMQMAYGTLKDALKAVAEQLLDLNLHDMADECATSIRAADKFISEHKILCSCLERGQMRGERGL